MVDVSPSDEAARAERAIARAQRRRLYRLREQAATMGIETPPHILTEIADLCRQLGIADDSSVGAVSELDDAGLLACYRVAVLAWGAADEARRGVNRLLLILPICLLLVLIVSRL